MRQAKHGKFKLKNPAKYLGDADNVVYRSSWEFRLMGFFDESPSITHWASEEIVIPYFWDGDMKTHRYFPDFVINANTNQGNKKFLIEVKPHAQTIEPVPKRGKKRETLINEVATYSKNQAKWRAAEIYCKERGWEFKIMTEKDIFKNGKPNSA